jgi:hypothetical protein
VENSRQALIEEKMFFHSFEIISWLPLKFGLLLAFLINWQLALKVLQFELIHTE